VKKKRLRDLFDWPPQPGGAYDAGTVFPTGGEAVVNDVFPVRDTTVTFHGVFKGGTSSYHYFAPNVKTAHKIYAAIAANLGKTASELGALEIDVE
jgi:hypothetical protein